MIVSHDKKFVYFHAPKTGGTSVGAVLKKYSSFKSQTLHCILHPHADAAFCFDLLGELKFLEYFKFGCVRNPWDLQVSRYFYIKSIKTHERHDWTRNGFKMFIDIFSKNMNNMNFNQFRYNDRLILDYVVKFENIQQDLNTACDKIGIPKQRVPHINKTNHKHYTEYYDDETRQIVAEKYAKDIEYFGYKFEDQ